MPKPHKNESRDDFMSRCVPMVKGEGKSQEQAVGMCMGIWDQHVKNQLQTVTVNIEADLVRDDVLEGEEYWVAPLVMMTECVANGSNGPLFYPAEELAKWSPAWDHKPMVAPGHPEDGSACTPEFLNNHKIGIVLNTKWDGKQRAFGWFHKKRTTAITPKNAEKLKRREMIELSTGLITDVDWTEGNFNGEKYIGITKNHRPDHLAILEDKVGACSIAKGAGVLQLNEASHDQIRMKLEVLLSELYADKMKEMPSLYPPYVRDVFDKYCIFHFAGNMYRISYSVSSSDQVSLVGDPTRVEVKVDYVPVKNTETHEEEITMPKKELIDKIIVNKELTGFDEGDRKMLEGWEDHRLEKIMKLAEKPTNNSDGLPKTKEELDALLKKSTDDHIKNNAQDVLRQASVIVANNQQQASKENEPPKQLSVQDFMAMMPPEMKTIYNQAMNSLQTEMSHLIGLITTNERNKFTKDQLAKMDIEVLRNMAAIASPETASQTNAMPVPGGNFMFAAPLPTHNSGYTKIKEEGLPAPVYNEEKFKQAAKS